jgi:hypothetical protein
MDTGDARHMHTTGKSSGPTCPTVADIRQKVADAAFGKALITNVLRGQVAEAIVHSALEPDWTWCAADYASWDLQRSDGLRAEVKQSAALQSWHDGRISRASFDIAPRNSWIDGQGWINPERAAHLYIFAHHPVTDETADHRNPAQWVFYVVPTADLPVGKTVGISTLAGLTTPCRFAALRDQVNAAVALIDLTFPQLEPPR